MILHRCKVLSTDLMDKLLIALQRKGEVRKFKDPRREAITSSVELTNEQKRQIDEFFTENYGRKIPYTWHRNYTAHSGKFDYKYFPELLFIPEFEKFMNLWPQYVKAFSDKNVLPMIAKSVGVKMPDTILSSVRGAYRDSDCRIISRDSALNILGSAGEVFIKPSVDSGSGKGCFLANFRDGIDIKSGKTVFEILDCLGDDFVAQERIRCHESISKIHPNSVNTFRIMTYRWRNEILTCPAIMRFGRGGSHLDNAHAGGIFIAITDEGTLHKKAITEFEEEFFEHPDSHMVFEGYNIKLFPGLIDVAKKMHEAIPQIGVINWDFTVDENETPVLIEANFAGGGIWIFEMVHGCGAFGEKTAEILQWVCLMKKTRASQRAKYAFGFNPAFDSKSDIQKSHAGGGGNF